MILPNINDEFLKHKIVDELPQTAAGKQIMTVEPKFIPSTTATIDIDNVKISLRFVDCVGEIIPSSEGYGNDNDPRLVTTPWYDDPIPFKEAALIGINQILSVLQAQAGNGADNLDDVQLGSAGILQDDVELGLLLNSLSSGSSGSGNSSSGGGNAENFFQSVDQFGQLQNGQSLYFFNESSDLFTSHGNNPPKIMFCLRIVNRFT